MTTRNEYEFIICPILGSASVGGLELDDVAWSDPVYGTGAAFSGKAAITKTQQRSQVYDLTQPDSVALYVKDTVTGTYPFGGPIYANPWNRSEHRVVVQAQSWKSWLYQKLCGMNRSTNPVTDKLYSWTNTDQFTIARNLITAVMAGEVGCPTINMGTELSGVLRELTFHGSDQKYLGAQIDSMANRDNGFEWNIDIRPDNQGRPSLWFAPSFPMRGGLNNQALLLHDEAQGGNILGMDDPENTSSERRSRVWTTGPGQPPDQMVAYDEDPALTGGSLLLRETVRPYNNGITKLTTLADHARAERVYRTQTIQQVSVDVSVDDPDLRTYASGDKVRLKVQDEWVQWDFGSVRIVDRVVRLNRSDKPDMASLLIDLNDTELPENQAVV